MVTGDEKKRHPPLVTISKNFLIRGLLLYNQQITINETIVVTIAVHSPRLGHRITTINYCQMNFYIDNLIH